MEFSAKRKYDRFSMLYDLAETMIERRLFSSLRQKAMWYVHGKVLEVGIGTGKNIPYYPKDVEVVGVDFSRGMLKKAEKKKTDLEREQLTLQEMDVQRMSFDDEIFDTVLSTFVFCTVPDTIKGLKEVYRVLKKGGKAVFLEHMKSNKLLLNIFLFLMNIFSKILLGTSMLRETQKNIEKSGFKIQERHDLLRDIIRLIIVTK